MFKKKDKELNTGHIVIPVGHPNPPEPHEVEAATILARHFRCVVEFKKRSRTKRVILIDKFENVIELSK